MCLSHGTGTGRSSRQIALPFEFEYVITVLPFQTNSADMSSRAKDRRGQITVRWVKALPKEVSDFQIGLDPVLRIQVAYASPWLSQTRLCIIIPSIAFLNHLLILKSCEVKRCRRNRVVEERKLWDAEVATRLWLRFPRKRAPCLKP